MKAKEGNECFFRYRMPLPSDGDWHRRSRFSAMDFLAAQKLFRDRERIWEHPEEIYSVIKNTASSFVRERDGRIEILASSMDWFQEAWGRDTFISLPGIFLATGRYEDAKRSIIDFSGLIENGLIPNRIRDTRDPSSIEYNTVDASLWFIQSVKKYMEYTGEKEFVRSVLPAMRTIISAYMNGTGYQRYGRFNRIYMDTDGLIVSPSQATWMDADPGGQDRPVTPRNGKAVEINALWYSALEFMHSLENKIGDPSNAGQYLKMMDLVKRSFNEKFWNARENALYDVIDGDPHKGAIRPNMILAVSLSDNLLSPERQKGVLEAAAKDLLTPYGLRTLSPRDSNYKGKYETWKPPVEKDLAYHQGTVWPWLIGPYVDALARVRHQEGKSGSEIREEIRKTITPLLVHLLGSDHCTLPEVFDGDSVHSPGGTRSQAWSVAEVLRVISEYAFSGEDIPGFSTPAVYGRYLSNEDMLELVLLSRKICVGYGTCKEHSLTLTKLLLERGVNVVIKRRAISPHAVHFWVEEVSPRGRIMDAFPEGMGEEGTAAASTVRDERYIITPKDSTLALTLYTDGTTDKAAISALDHFSASADNSTSGIEIPGPIAAKSEDQEYPGKREDRTLRDIANIDQTAKNLAESMLSASFNKKIVLAFDSGLASLQGGNPKSVINALERLKDDPVYRRILSRVEILIAPAERLPFELDTHLGRNDTEIFIFFRESERQRLSGLESRTRANCIDERDFPLDAYYPLAEVIVIAFAQYFDTLIPEGETIHSLETGGKDLLLKNINIDSVTRDNGVLVFKLLPDAKPMEISELIQKYAALKRMLVAA
ncbi:MAG: amylo-alpha-1,6-glucosidase [Candidatus Omnitrophica bacterium]|nr:amylo-alpha-1,6-glucosidase [Candidatus Omnitrophota bacterium]